MAKEPESWGEPVANYRDDYGSRSYQTIKKYGSNTSDGNGGGGSSATAKKGTGRRLIPGAGPGVAANRPAPAHLTDRKNLFGVLQGSEAGATDGWIGNELIDPTTGKKSKEATGGGSKKSWIKMDKGTKVEDDGWIGNIEICPTKGKKPTPGPEQRTARKDLFEVMNGTGNSSIQDSWIGNIAIDPTKGKGFSGRASDQDLHSVMQHQYLKSDGRGPAVDPAAQASRMKKENIGGFNFSDANEQTSSKIGKRIIERPANTQHTSEKKTGTKKLPVPGAFGSIGPTATSQPGLLSWKEPQGAPLASVLRTK